MQYYEKVSDPLDLSTIEKQILTGHYKTVEAFDTDMLKVFRNAEVSPAALFLYSLDMFLIASVNFTSRPDNSYDCLALTHHGVIA